LAAEFLLYGDIGADVRADALLRAIRRAEADDDALLIRINSLGGEVFEGIAMAEAIADAQADIAVAIDAVAASAASIVAIASPTVSIAADAFVMIHQPWGITAGDAAEHKRAAGMLNRLADRMARTYARRMRIGADRVMSMMREETWFCGAEAVAAGLADAMKPARKVRAPASALTHRRTPTALSCRAPAFDRVRTDLALADLRARL